MAMTPRLPQPRELVGAWRLTIAGAGPCRVRLELTAGGERRLAGAAACAAAHAGLEEAVCWRVAPDGLGLTREDGSLVLFLNREAPDRYAIRLADGRRLELVRGRRPPR